METVEMKIKFEKYPVYKDPGVEWIGEIPEEWEVIRLAAFGNFLKGGGFSKSDLTRTGAIAILYGDIYTKYDITIKKGARCISEETAKKSVAIEKGNLLLTGSGETIEDIGKCVLYDIDEKAFAGGDIIIFRQTQNDGLFLSYCLNSEGAKNERAKTAKGEIIVHTYASKLRQIYLPIPPLAEQTAIATFLDDKTAKIDTAIAQKEKMIRLLQERRQIIIQELVTGKKVWNGTAWAAPAEVKDSGVEWIGEIPVGWKCVKLSYVAKVDSGATPDRSKPNYWNGDIPWVKTGEVKYCVITKTEEYITEAGLRNSATKIAPIGTLLMAMYGQGVTRGRVALLGIPATYNQACCAMTFNSILQNTFGYYYFVAAYSHIRDEGNETSQMNISTGYISSLKILIPPPEAQKAIVHHIQTQSAKIDKAITLQQAQIEKLKEYKATLINSAVTGKIKVL